MPQISRRARRSANPSLRTRRASMKGSPAAQAPPWGMSPTGLGRMARERAQNKDFLRRPVKQRLHLKLQNRRLTVDVLRDETVLDVLKRSVPDRCDELLALHLPTCRLLRSTGSKLLDQLQCLQDDPATHGESEAIWLITSEEFDAYCLHLDSHDDLPSFHGRAVPMHPTLLSREQLQEFAALNSRDGAASPRRVKSLCADSTSAENVAVATPGVFDSPLVPNVPTLDAPAPKIPDLPRPQESEPSSSLPEAAADIPSSSSSFSSSSSSTKQLGLSSAAAAAAAVSASPSAATIPNYRTGTPGTIKPQASSSSRARPLVGYDRPNEDIMVVVGERRRGLAEKEMARRRAIQEEKEAVARAAAERDEAVLAAACAAEELGREAARLRERINQLEADKVAMERKRVEEEKRAAAAAEAMAASAAAAVAAAVAAAEAAAAEAAEAKVAAAAAAKAAAAALEVATAELPPSPPPPPPLGPPPASLSGEGGMQARPNSSSSAPPKSQRRASLKFVAPKRRSVTKATVRRVVTLLPTIQGRNGEGDDGDGVVNGGDADADAAGDSAFASASASASASAAPELRDISPPARSHRCASLKFVSPRRRSTLRRQVWDAGADGEEDWEEGDEEEGDEGQGRGQAQVQAQERGMPTSRSPFSTAATTLPQNSTIELRSVSVTDAVPEEAERRGAAPAAPVAVVAAVAAAVATDAVPPPPPPLLPSDKPSRRGSPPSKAYAFGLGGGNLSMASTPANSSEGATARVSVDIRPSLGGEVDADAHKLKLTAGGPDLTHSTSPTPSPLRQRIEPHAATSPTRARTPSGTLEARLGETRTMLQMLDGEPALPTLAAQEKDPEMQFSPLGASKPPTPTPAPLADPAAVPAPLPTPARSVEVASRGSTALNLDQMEREAQGMQAVLGMGVLSGRSISPTTASAAHLMHLSARSSAELMGFGSSSSSTSSLDNQSTSSIDSSSTSSSMESLTRPRAIRSETRNTGTDPIEEESVGEKQQVCPEPLQIPQPALQRPSDEERVSPMTPESPACSVLSRTFEMGAALSVVPSQDSPVEEELPLSSLLPAPARPVLLPYPSICVLQTTALLMSETQTRGSGVAILSQAPTPPDYSRLLPLELCYLPFIRTQASFRSAYGVLRLGPPCFSSSSSVSSCSSSSSSVSSLLDVVSDCTAWIATLWMVFQLYGQQDGPLCRAISSQQVMRALKESGFKEDVCNRLQLTAMLVMTKTQAAQQGKGQSQGPSAPRSKTGTVKAAIKKAPAASEKNMSFKEFLLVMNAFADSMKDETDRRGGAGGAGAGAGSGSWFEIDDASAAEEPAAGSGRVRANSMVSGISTISDDLDYLLSVRLSSPGQTPTKSQPATPLESRAGSSDEEQAPRQPSFREVLVRRLRMQYGKAPIKNSATYGVDELLDRAPLCLSGLLALTPRVPEDGQPVGPAPKGTLSSHFSVSALEGVRGLWERNATLFEQLYSYYAETIEARAPGQAEESVSQPTAPGPVLHPVFAQLRLWNTSLSSAGQAVPLLSFDQLLVLLKDFGVLGPLVDLQKLHRAFKGVKLWEWALADAVAGPSAGSSVREPRLFRPAAARASSSELAQGKAGLPPSLVDPLDPLGTAATSRSLALTLGGLVELLSRIAVLDAQLDPAPRAAVSSLLRLMSESGGRLRVLNSSRKPKSLRSFAFDT